MTTETFYTTKPKLALALIEHGFAWEKTANLFNEKLCAWKFELTPDLAIFVNRFYLQRGERPPKQIELYLARNY